MIDKHVTALKKKHVHTRSDVTNLIFYCETLILRNEKIAEELEKALQQILYMENRLNFYQKVTKIKMTGE